MNKAEFKDRRSRGEHGVPVRRAEIRLRQDVEDKHLEAKGTLAVSTGLYGLQPDPTTPERWLHTLIQRFARMLDRQPLLQRTQGAA